MTVSALLQRWTQGDEVARDQLMPLIYETLREVALVPQARDDFGALAYEVYSRLVRTDMSWGERVHFLAAAARAIRCLLLDHLRGPAHLVCLARACRKLSVSDPRKAELLEMLYFAGLTLEECGFSLGISTTTVHREATEAKAWLRRELATHTLSSEVFPKVA
ncbi:DNA-directed RNA polymerase sigma-70 factor [Bryobacterales bacterium F-183]|nr:DNA-directed RNA polymerase sigma-70 factor [Bryobacterales bacterium F-183]